MLNLINIPGINVDHTYKNYLNVFYVNECKFCRVQVSPWMASLIGTVIHWTLCLCIYDFFKLFLQYDRSVFFVPTTLITFFFPAGQDIEQLAEFRSISQIDEFTVLFREHVCVMLSALEVLGYQVVTSSSTLGPDPAHITHIWTMRRALADPDLISADGRFQDWIDLSPSQLLFPQFFCQLFFPCI